MTSKSLSRSVHLCNPASLPTERLNPAIHRVPCVKSGKEAQLRFSKNGRLPMSGFFFIYFVLCFWSRFSPLQISSSPLSGLSPSFGSGDFPFGSSLASFTLQQANGTRNSLFFLFNTPHFSPEAEFFPKPPPLLPSVSPKRVGAAT